MTHAKNDSYVISLINLNVIIELLQYNQLSIQAKVWKRKGLPTDELIVVNAEKQRNLKRNK